MLGWRRPREHGGFVVRRLAFALLLLLAMAACGQPAALEVKDVWARDTVGSTASAAVFMTITSDSADRLIGASTPAADKTDLMTMKVTGDAMAMAYLDAIDIPAHRTVTLDPAGLHVWLADLDGPLENGDSIPLDLTFEKAGERRVSVAIIGPSAAPPMRRGM